MNEFDIPDALDWHEGMLLSPHHFQIMNRRSEALIYKHVNTLSPYHYGFSLLDVDPAKLLEGIFLLRAFEAIMPDGLIVSLESGGEGLSLNLNSEIDTFSDGPVKIHLAVPKRRSDEDGRTESTRYESIEGPITVDETLGQGSLQIPRIRPRISIIAGDVSSSRFCSMPIAEVELKDESFNLTSFVPPYLLLGSSKVIYDLCSTVVTRLREKAAFLIEGHRSEGGHENNIRSHSNEVASALICHLPLLEGLCSADKLHPFEIYKSLLGVVGSVASVGNPVIPSSLPSFNQSDPLQSIALAVNFILQRLNHIQAASTEIVFKEEGGIFRLKVEEQWDLEKLVIAVRRRPDTPVEKINAWMQQALIASETLIDKISERRMLGAPRLPVVGDDTLGVKSSGQVSVFQIERSGGFIIPDQTLLIMNRIDQEEFDSPVEIILFLPNNKK